MTSQIRHEVEKLYAQHPDMDLQRDLDWFSRFGVVVDLDSHFVLAHRVRSGWLVWVAVGKGCMGEFFEAMPYWLPYVGWARRDREGIRWYDTERTRRLVNAVSRKETTI